MRDAVGNRPNGARQEAVNLVGAGYKHLLLPNAKASNMDSSGYYATAN